MWSLRNRECPKQEQLQSPDTRLFRELCERADVNRTTFYKYYGSQFDLLTDMENDLLSLLAMLVKDPETDTITAIEAACTYLQDHLEFARQIFNNNVDPAFPQKVFSMEGVKEAVIFSGGSPLDFFPGRDIIKGG